MDKEVYYRKKKKKRKKQQLPEPIILVRANMSDDKLQKEEYVTIELLNFQQDAIICMVFVKHNFYKNNLQRKRKEKMRYVFPMLKKIHAGVCIF